MSLGKFLYLNHNFGGCVLFMLHLGKTHAWLRWNHLIEALKANNYQPEKAGASHIFLSTKAKCVSLPKPP
jgi:hypothetical protein